MSLCPHVQCIVIVLAYIAVHPDRTEVRGHAPLSQVALDNILGCAPAGGRVVFVNAELHTLASDATPDFIWKKDGLPAYCRYHQHDALCCVFMLRHRMSLVERLSGAEANLAWPPCDLMHGLFLHRKVIIVLLLNHPN